MYILYILASNSRMLPQVRESMHKFDNVEFLHRSKITLLQVHKKYIHNSGMWTLTTSLIHMLQIGTVLVVIAFHRYAEQFPSTKSRTKLDKKTSTLFCSLSLYFYLFCWAISFQQLSMNISMNRSILAIKLKPQEGLNYSRKRESPQVWANVIL